MGSDSKKSYEYGMKLHKSYPPPSETVSSLPCTIFLVFSNKLVYRTEHNVLLYTKINKRFIVSPGIKKKLP